MSDSQSDNPHASIALIGGSGLYELAGLEGATEVRIDTPFGSPSDDILVGALVGRPAAFLARHGRGHRLLPSEVNHRANIYALKCLGVERILSASAVGSMREQIRPRDVVLVDQFIDRSMHRQATFFGNGVAAHIGFADPVCPALRSAALAAARNEQARTHDGGTYLCIEGPAFSTRAESELYRAWGVDVIGMTNIQEAKLAREAEICYSTLALVTDYDCWHEEEEEVSVSGVIENLRANSRLAGSIVRNLVRGLPADRTECACSEALRLAIITSRESISEEAIERLKPLIGKYLGRGVDGAA
jgi:5'-methylthioadenosine phosphorylase